MSATPSPALQAALAERPIWSAPAALRFCTPFAFLATVPLGLFLGGAWSFLTLGVAPLALTSLDVVFGSEADTTGEPDGLALRALPWIYAALQAAVTVWAAILAATPTTSGIEVAGAAVSVGLTGGIFGMLCAHELIHRGTRVDRTGGLALLALYGYMHFAIAHVHGHHVRAATPHDPASAQRGEGAYRFLVRSVAGQIAEAWRFEAQRLGRRGRRPLHPANRLLDYGAIQILIAAGFSLLGLRALGFWAAQAVLAVVLLELFNYIAHYGLQRRRGPDGVPERLGPQHSWNSARRMNNAALFNMGRHSDHHRRPAQPYHRLDGTPGAPELPSGYAGAILLALVPPLWRAVMDPRLDRLAAARDATGNPPCA